LRGHNPGTSWWRYEKTVCDQLGIEHYDLRVNSRALPSRELLIGLLDAFDASKKPFLIKCSGGQDRTSLASALYIIHLNGWNSMAHALDQFASWPYLHWPRRQQQWLKLFLPYAKEQAQGQSLHQWIVSRYAPEEYMAWLDAKGMHDSFRNLPGEPPRNYAKDKHIAAI
jgi:hypothetical protein